MSMNALTAADRIESWTIGCSSWKVSRNGSSRRSTPSIREQYSPRIQMPAAFARGSVSESRLWQIEDRIDSNHLGFISINSSVPLSTDPISDVWTNLTGAKFAGIEN